MTTILTTELVEVVRTASKAVTGFARRSFQSTMAAKFCDSNPRQAESVFGWNRKAVRRGLEEQKLGKAIQLPDDPRGRPTVESEDPAISTISRQLLAEKTQVDPKFQTSYAFTRMTGESLRTALAEQLGIPISRLPAARTLRRVMNRNGFLLKKVRKTMPLKKIKKTNPILEVEAHQLTIGFGHKVTTSDLIADNLEQWWLHRREHYGNIRKLMIDLDNGTEFHRSSAGWRELTKKE